MQSIDKKGNMPDRAVERIPPSGNLPTGIAGQLHRLNRDLRSVHKTSQLLTGPMGLQQMLDIVLKTVCEAIGVDAAGIRLLDEESGELELKATYGLSDDYKNKGPVTADESSLNRRALTGESIVVEDMRSDPRFQKHIGHIVREGLVSTLYIGLMYKEQGIGIFRLYTRRQRRFSTDDIALAQTIAAQSAAAIVNARLYTEALEGERIARQIKLAGTVQRQLIPQKAPDIPGYELAGVYDPCYDVGGDFYDFIPMQDGSLIVAIGDVMGKGVPASLTMASLRSALRAYSEQTGAVDELANRLNRLFCRDSQQWEFVTLFCARIDPRRDTVEYCNCGHEQPVILRDDDEVTTLGTSGMVLGIEAKTHYQAQSTTMRSGDLLLMYTDGLADAMNFQQESFGRGRIVQAAQASRHMRADQAVRNILWLMRKFAGLTQRCDDTAVVVLKKQ